ncbi:hypothetical protein BDW72DRAFT_24952 [Aspergillus terricola var. indicus]
MALSSRADIIKTKPIGEGLSAFRDNLALTCKESELAYSVNSISQLNAEVLQDLCLDLIAALQVLPALHVLRSVNSSRNLFSNLLRLGSAVNSNNFNSNQLIPLLAAIINKESNDTVWDRVYSVTAKSTPPSRLLPFLGQTPYLHTTSSFVNSSEHRKYVDDVLKEELGLIYIRVPDFYDAYFRNIDSLEQAGASVLRRCKEGNSPLFDNRNGWQDWLETAKEKEVLDWLLKVISEIRELATEENFTTLSNYTVLAHPSQPLQGSTADQKLDVGIMCNLNARDCTQYYWSHVLVLGKLKSSLSTDTVLRICWAPISRIGSLRQTID